jgi:hypothetical protein
MAYVLLMEWLRLVYVDVTKWLATFINAISSAHQNQMFVS